MNKTIKKIVALGMGATMLAGTAAAVFAADLSDYPSPFIKDNVFVGKIVIGEKAAAIDVIGATDIAASLQRDAAVGVSGSNGGSTSTATSGYKFAENDVLVLGNNLSSVGKTTVDDTDLPELLKSGTVENDDSEFDYDVSIDFTKSAGVVAASLDSDLEDLGYTKPIVYFSLDEGAAYQTVIDFQDKWSAEDFKNSETIELFGTEYTFSPDNKNSDDVLTLYGSENTMTIAKGGSETVTYNGKEYTVEVIGGNSDDSTAILRINGDTRTVKEGDSKTMPAGGLPIYVKNVFVTNIGGEDVSVELFVGSNKLELDASTGTVTKNSVDLPEVEVETDTGTWANVSTVTFTVTPSDADEEQNFILPKEAYVDPVFGAFELYFVGAEDLTKGKELIAIENNGDEVTLSFQPKGTNEPVDVLLLKDNATSEDIFTANTTLTNVEKDKIFFYNDGTKAEDYETHVLQVTSIKYGNNLSNSDFEVVVKDLTNGKTYTMDDGNSPMSSDIALYASAGATAKNITFLDRANTVAMVHNVTNTLYTKAGASIALSAGDTVFTIDEDAEGDADTATADHSIVVTASYPVDQYNLAVTGAPTKLTDYEDNNDYYLTQFGTYIDAETEDDAYVHFYVPAEEVSYDMFLMPVDAEVVTTSSSNGGAVALNPISVGMAILDSEATLGNKPYIVVGGPCANTVAAELMGNPAVCESGFTEGKAMIKLYSAKNALLVAGYSGKDTQGASRVLANYKDYDFTGTELEITTANLNSLTVKKLS